ncbi:hypothetical protein NONS58_11640 [Nitrosococcus oceani]|nr:hypothetical protein NONS58_11640 [Nitrosococcus oceani]
MNVEVLPAYDGSDSLGSYSSVSDLEVSKGWRAGKHKKSLDNGAYDYGMVILSNDNITTDRHKALEGKPLGYWGHPSQGHKTVFAPLGIQWLQSRINKRFFTAGYHKETKRAMQVRWGNIPGSGLVVPDGQGGVIPGRGMVFDALAPLEKRARGMSGGPIWYKVRSKRFSTRFMVGINTSAKKDGVTEIDEKGREHKKWQGYAARVTLEFFEEVSGWMHAKP